jgi:outer membrane lipoprotein-sorting protein
MKRIWTRWLPAAAVPAAIAVGVLAGGAVAETPPPPATPQQVLALAAGHTAQQFSGMVEEKTDLGLPSIPSQALAPATSSASLGSEAAILELLTTPHTARVYADGPTKLRVQIMDELAERDAVRNGNDVWTFDSKANAVTHTALPATHGNASPSAPPVTPDQLAQRLLAAADSTTSIALGSPTSVAGHSAYTLVLTPKSAGTLVASVQIFVEAKTGFPLGVDVYAKDQPTPAFHSAFTQLDLAAPAASVFAFTPPPGATVKQEQAPAEKASHPTAPAKQPVNGKGWDTIVTVPAGSVPAGLLDSPLLKQLATPVAGGRALSSSLVNVLVTNDGRILAGAVPLSALEAAAK